MPPNNDYQEVEYPIVRPKAQPRIHRILSFGYPVTVNAEVPTAYRFQYPPDPDGAPDELHMGIIPAGYKASIRVNREGEDASGVDPSAETSEIFFCSREGQLGPEFRVCFQDLESVLMDWTDDVDTLWIEVMTALEDTQALGEAALEFLDCDPLFLFGIADPTTQKAVERTSNNVVPMLRCSGAIPTLHEWFSYLQADPQIDEEYTWVIESFADQELPPPWTSVIGVGSIICYVNEETSESTWKHPFYDYFAQLLDHCRHVSKEEHIKLRINRMLWSYEAECNSNILTQEPIVSPRYVREIAEILKVDVVAEPFMVRTIKVFIKAFSLQYRLETELDTQEVKYCLEIIDNERNRFQISQEVLEQEDPSATIGPNEAGQVYCVECGIVASCYCPKCRDCLCETCFEKLHMKGNRKLHVPNHLIPCCLCRTLPAKLQCTYTFGSYCHECYTGKHVKTLPRFLDLKPVKIDYTRDYAYIEQEEGTETKRRSVGHSLQSQLTKAQASHGTGPGGRVLAKGELDPRKELLESLSRTAPPHTLLGIKWHAFFDRRGSKYFHNFETGESLHRPQETRLADDWDLLLKETGLADSVLANDSKKLKELKKLAT
ncbi:hypothetical protein FOL47_008913, partial [Perkinsus chesapeaki]